MNIAHKETSYRIIGAAMAVHGELGCGFTEKVYQDALEIEFQERGIEYQREPQIHATYHNNLLDSTFIPDFICDNAIIVELKAVKDLDNIHRSQAINYAKIAKMDLAILINFGDTSLEFERFPNLNKDTTE